MSTPQKPTAESLRDVCRRTEFTLPNNNHELERVFGILPFSQTTWKDLIIGPDNGLGPNQIRLREFIINEALNNGILPVQADFLKFADDRSPDDLARELISILENFKRNFTKIQSNEDYIRPKI